MGKKDMSWIKPVILQEGSYTESSLDSFRKVCEIEAFYDLYFLQLEELFEITHPSEKEKVQLQIFLQKYMTPSAMIRGNWIYFPWSKTLIHTVREDDYFALRTNRNKLLITKEEQEKLRLKCIAVAGLSIGSHFAVSFSYSGIAKHLKLADFDFMATSNLNRVRAALADVGQKKIEIVARQIYEIDPYAKLSLFEKGITKDSLNEFVNKDGRPHLLFDAIDDLKMKILLRLEARKMRIPVIMLTNLGDSILIDVERYDKKPSLPLFNGLIGNTPEEILKTTITPQELTKLVIKIVGKHHIPPRAIDSLSEINKTLVGRPQLYSTVVTAGGLAVYFARRLFLTDDLPSGRNLFSFDNALFLRNNK